ncbi:hypothetical protein NN561_019948 [Cricetulus griseus]
MALTPLGPRLQGKRVVLASASPRRRDILRLTGQGRRLRAAGRRRDAGRARGGRLPVSRGVPAEPLPAGGRRPLPGSDVRDVWGGVELTTEVTRTPEWRQEVSQRGQEVSSGNDGVGKEVTSPWLGKQEVAPEAGSGIRKWIGSDASFAQRGTGSDVTEPEAQEAGSDPTPRKRVQQRRGRRHGETGSEAAGRGRAGGDIRDLTGSGVGEQEVRPALHGK